VEELTTGDPQQLAFENARRKALAVPSPLTLGAEPGSDAARQGRLVLGADTDVALDGEILGKPEDAEQARDYLARLSGRHHLVVGGIALAQDGELRDGAVEVTTVRFRPLSAAEIDWYVATGEWRGRAGGYAIQGAGGALVAAIGGDYLNVVGLPLARLLTLRPQLLPTAASREGPAA
jgi:septum formation protein